MENTLYWWWLDDSAISNDNCIELEDSTGLIELEDSTDCIELEL